MDQELKKKKILSEGMYERYPGPVSVSMSQKHKRKPKLDQKNSERQLYYPFIREKVTLVLINRSHVQCERTAFW